MMDESAYLANKVARDTTRVCNMQIVFADIVAYSLRRTHQQIHTILAFTNCFKEALRRTASAYTDEMAERGVHLQRDIVTVPTGDGVGIGFPFDLPGISLDFVDHLVATVDAHNKLGEPCPMFDYDGFCDCHDRFRLRIGISEGQTVLYRDLNGRINVAGNDVNLAARIMGLAGSNQVFLTNRAYQTVTELVRGRDKQFRAYRAARVKHGVHLDVYQYANAELPGLDVSVTPGLEAYLSEPATEPSTLSARDAPPPPDQDSDAQSTSEAVGEVLPALDPRVPMVEVNQKQFTMGNDTAGRVDVLFSRPFLISAQLVTQDVYEAAMGINPSHFVGTKNPVERVSWYDAVKFCNALSEAEGYAKVYEITGQDVVATFLRDGYRLPTEAEWELSARGEAGEDRYGPIDEIAWYRANADGRTHPVAGLLPNRGVYDLLGNVWEWCGDWYQREHPTQPGVDHSGPEWGSRRVIRGGSWRDQAQSVGAGSRGHESPGKVDDAIGFRVVRIPVVLS
ncbi:MAG: SUMF1/EgtB/PvdO family nonheme iron enzyme [Solirubrobacteraceae bacterium]